MKYAFDNNHLNIETDAKTRSQTAAQFLEEWGLARKSRYLLLQDNRLLLDGKPVRNTEMKLYGNVLSLVLKGEEPDWITGTESCEVAYEDPFALIVHKDPGIIIHGDEDDTDCLNARVSRYYSDHDMHMTVRPIHRLDKDTAGLVFYSKIPFFQPWFDAELAAKRIHRHYLAVVYGKKKVGDTFTCNSRIGADRHNSNRYRVSSTGKDACTHFTVLAQCGDYNLIGCELKTGRTHQIRVHLSSLGLPIVNDPLYGRPSHAFDYMGLRADEMTFRNPLNHKKHKILDPEDREYAFFKKEK